MFASEIESLLKTCRTSKHFKWLGCYPADMLPKHLPKKCSFTMNTDPHTMPGSHWQTVIRDNDNITLFCPLGRRPTKQLLSYMRQFKNAKYSVQKIQKRSERTCGAYTVFMCELLACGVPLTSVLELFKNVIEQDDLFLKTWLKKVHNFTLE